MNLGYVSVSIEEKADLVEEFYRTKKNLFGLIENQYLIIFSEQKPKDIYCYQNNNFRKIIYTFQNSIYGEVRGRNTYQSLAVDMLMDRATPVKLLTGVFGSAKTFLMIQAAYLLIEKGKKEKIIFIRNGIGVKDAPDIGFLPGNQLEKTIQWAMPMADHLGGVDSLVSLINQGFIEVEPLNFIRGRDYKNCILINDESENLTRQHIQLILGRAAEGSEVWFNADLRQRDAKKFEESKGIEVLSERLSGNRLFAHVHMPKSERGPVASLADFLD
jgi:PhoH-like ATPase